ncbi:MAG: tRNA pseudouridine(54/55) synthase Pus10 [Candidatus Bathyarchaeota archaeon]|nr:MAG: tRNA pseudouridine(54/55) synthase Pus10 [Candidatus Bathyarchaeota archaeon]
MLATSLCNHCLGRQFALLGYGLKNDARGEILRSLLALEAYDLLFSDPEKALSLLNRVVAEAHSCESLNDTSVDTQKVVELELTCYLCNGRFKAIPVLSSRVMEALKDYEFSTFLVGIELPFVVIEREDEFKGRCQVSHSESMKSHFSRVIGKQVAFATEKLVDHHTPDIVALVNPFVNSITLQVNSLYVAGRYRKLVRGIPQSRWLCSECHGAGCVKCDWVGKKYPESIEELIGIPVYRHANGREIAFHGAGREDIDTLMLGSGRPFVVEIKEPKKRFINLATIRNEINAFAEGKIEVGVLVFADKDVVRRIKKAEASKKIYNAIVEFARDVTAEELRRIEDVLCGSVIHQQTPLRVLQRRADLIREKHIYAAKLRRLSKRRAELKLHCQGGLYVKELISGDEGRTKPSLASIIDTEAKSIQLDVLGVID